MWRLIRPGRMLRLRRRRGKCGATLDGGDIVRGDSDLSDQAMGDPVAQAQTGRAPAQAKAAAFGKLPFRARRSAPA